MLYAYRVGFGSGALITNRSKISTVSEQKLKLPRDGTGYSPSRTMDSRG